MSRRPVSACIFCPDYTAIVWLSRVCFVFAPFLMLFRRGPRYHVLSFWPLFGRTHAYSSWAFRSRVELIHVSCVLLLAARTQNFCKRSSCLRDLSTRLGFSRTAPMSPRNLPSYYTYPSCARAVIGFALSTLHTGAYLTPLMPLICCVAWHILDIVVIVYCPRHSDLHYQPGSVLCKTGLLVFALPQLCCSQLTPVSGTGTCSVFVALPYVLALSHILCSSALSLHQSLPSPPL